MYIASHHAAVLVLPAYFPHSSAAGGGVESQPCQRRMNERKTATEGDKRLRARLRGYTRVHVVPEWRSFGLIGPVRCFGSDTSSQPYFKGLRGSSRWATYPYAVPGLEQGTVTKYNLRWAWAAGISDLAAAAGETALSAFIPSGFSLIYYSGLECREDPIPDLP